MMSFYLPYEPNKEPKPKYRIVKTDGLYFIQKRFWIFWLTMSIKARRAEFRPAGFITRAEAIGHLEYHINKKSTPKFEVIDTFDANGCNLNLKRMT